MTTTPVDPAPAPSRALRLAKILVPLGILAVAALGTAGMVLSREAAGKAEPEARLATVAVQTVQSGPVAQRVEGTGVVESWRQVTVVPQVPGRLVWVAGELRPGGRFSAGSALARVEATDYEASLAQARAALAQAELELALEGGRGDVATREWSLLGDADRDEAMALRRPQRAAVEAQVASARGAVAVAEANVARTTLVAPFPALVLTEGVDVGQVIGATTQVATLVDATRFRVSVSVAVQDLARLEVPGVNATRGSAAEVVLALPDGTRHVRQGEVTGLAGQLDTQTRTARLLVEVADPLELTAAAQVPLLPGAYVTVSMAGRALDRAWAVPRASLYEGRVVWTVRDGALARNEVTVGWADGQTVAVVDGLADGDQVVVSPLSLPIEGTPVRLSGDAQ